MALGAWCFAGETIVGFCELTKDAPRLQLNAMTAPLVFDVTAATFQSAVVETSRKTAVLVDFWAEWCEPCKTFSVTVQKVVEEYGGAFVVGKVDSDAEQELSQAFQVQSIPFGVLIHNGSPVDAFAGALGEVELRELLAKHGIQPATPEDSDAEPDPDSAEGRLRRARQSAADGDVEGARTALEGFPEESELLPEQENMAAGLAFLEAELPSSPEASAQLSRAREHFLAGRWQEALEAVVASAAEDRDYADGLARNAMRLFQGTLGESELVDEYRRRLATLLY